MSLKKFFICLALSIGLVSTASAVNFGVDLELSLLVDVSGSVDTTEFELQRDGYVDAFRSASVQTAIADGAIGSIAVNYIYWSGGTQQQETVGFTLLDSVASINAFADAIAAAARPFNNLTAPGSALNFATPLFAANAFDGTRSVIDVSGDGSQNDGANTANARDAALAAGIDTINGLPIGGEAGVEAFYTNNIVGGGGFVLPANSFSDFSDAVALKLVAEITDTDPTIPEPSILALFAFGLLGVRRFSRA